MGSGLKAGKRSERRLWKQITLCPHHDPNERSEFHIELMEINHE